MVDRDPFGDRLQEHRLAGARRRDDQRSLAVADRRDQVDRAPRELGADLRRLSRFERELALGIRGDERAEIGAAQHAPSGSPPFTAVISATREPAALIASGGRLDQVAAAKRELAHELRRNERIARQREIALLGAANEPAIACGVEPSGGRAVGDEHGDGRVRVLLGAWPVALAAAPAAAAVRVVRVAIAVVAIPLSRLSPCSRLPRLSSRSRFACCCC